MMNRRTLLFVVAAFMLGSLTFNLGLWQTRRAEEKRALESLQAAAAAQAPLTPTTAVLPDPEALRYRRLLLRGQFMPDAWVALDNRQIAGRPAVSIIQAFRVMPGDFVVMVDRGLLPRNPSAPRDLPAFADKDQVVTIAGVLQLRFPRTAELWGLRVADASRIHRNGREWSNFGAAEFEQDYREQLGGQPLGNFVVQQLDDPSVDAGEAKPVFTRAVTAPGSDVSKHRGYAFQWFSLTVLLGVMVLWAGWKEWRGRSMRVAGGL